MPVELDLPRIPDEPGVYLFRDADGAVLYVGKAASLRARLASYRQPQEDVRKEGMLAKAESVEVVLTRSEKEALLLEASLVRRHKPRYNVRLTDDKRYPYLRLTGGDWPRIALSRDTKDPESTYFGPFPDAGAARRTLEVVRASFRIRNCKELVPGGCLAFQLRLCWAPCVPDEATRVRAVGPGDLAHADVGAEYARATDGARRFLRGDAAAVTSLLQDEMDAAAERTDFEHAARLRDRIRAVRETLERQAVFGRSRDDRDVVAIARDGSRAVGIVVMIRHGEVAGQSPFTFRRLPPETTDGELVSEFVRRYYENLPAVPAEIVVRELPPDHDALAAHLADRRSAPVRLREAARGELARAVELAERNARFRLEQQKLARGEAEWTAELADLADRLELPAPPSRVECVDISHLGGADVVASLAVLVEGRPKPSEYRRFKLSLDRNDDFAAMREVVARRLAREDWPRPDLLLVDGGAGQLAAAREGAAGREVPLAALAKREEEVWWFPDPAGPPRRLAAPREYPGLLALERVRDEAHRFALAYQRRRRASRLAKSGLDDVPGIGEARKRALLAHFGSPDAVARASEEELANVPGIGRAVARRLHETLSGPRDSPKP